MPEAVRGMREPQLEVEEDEELESPEEYLRSHNIEFYLADALKHLHEHRAAEPAGADEPPDKRSWVEKAKSV